MSDPTYIPDGYTRKGLIAAVPGLHGALKFEYRPLLRDEREALYRESNKRSPAEFNGLIRKMLVKQLVSWDAKHDEKELPIDNETLRRLQPALSTKLENIVAGYSPTDLDETASQEDVDGYVASLEGEDARQVADLGNSETG
jgi:hypothetical protein